MVMALNGGSAAENKDTMGVFQSGISC